MLVDRDINSPIRLLLLGSDSDIGETLFRHTQSLSEFEVTSLKVDDLLAANFLNTHEQTNGVLTKDYDFIVDAISMNKSLPMHYIEHTTHIKKWAEYKHADVMMISSSQVFSGEIDHSYEEDDTPDSQDKYGQRLAEIEQIFLANENNIVLRSGWLFGDEGKIVNDQSNNFVKDIITAAKTGETKQYKADCLGCPTPISDLIRVMLSVIKQRHYGAKNTGIYHYCCAEEVSWLSYAKAVLSIASQYDSKIDNVELHNEFSEASDNEEVEALRQSLSCRKIFNHFGVKQRPWRSNLKNLIKGLYQVD